MNKKILVAFAAKIKGLRLEAAALRRDGHFEKANQVDIQADGCATVVSGIAAEFNPRFDAGRFSAATSIV